MTTVPAPDVSVVMSVYNGARYLAPSIESVLCQEGVNLELVAVDDGSTDESPDILKLYAQRDSRVRVLAQEHRGLTRALILGCNEARGDCIARIDAGDTMAPDRLRLQKEALDRKPGVAFVSCWTEFFGPEWEPLRTEKGRQPPPDGGSALPRVPGENLVAGPTHHGSVMFRRSAYEAAGGYRSQFYYGQDWDLWYRLAEAGGFLIIPVALYKARLTADGIGAGNARRQFAVGRWSREAFRCRMLGLDESACLDKASRIRPRGAAKPARARAAGLYFIGEQLRRKGDPRCARYLRDAVKTWPWHLKAWLRLACASITGTDGSRV
jgi:glycosyltransferase involved in cell wall biosynthesis